MLKLFSGQTIIEDKVGELFNNLINRRKRHGSKGLFFQRNYPREGS